MRRILTYADNFALSFFHSQGFTHELTLHPAAYENRIGHYSESVLMECELYPEIPYACMPTFLRRAREECMRTWELAAPPVPAATLGVPSLSVCAACCPEEDTNKSQRGKCSQGIELGRSLSKLLEDCGRELADPARLSTDIGAPGVGTRLVPVLTPSPLPDISLPHPQPPLHKR